MSGVIPGYHCVDAVDQIEPGRISTQRMFRRLLGECQRKDSLADDKRGLRRDPIQSQGLDEGAVVAI